MGRDLTNLYISASFAGLTQISGSLLTDGTGSLISSLDITASNATTATSASYSTTATSASYADTAISASYTATASLLEGNAEQVSHIDFNTAGDTSQVARLKWNDTDGTVDLGLKGGIVTLQVGQEEVTRVVNKSGGDLLEANYQAVRILGAQGSRLSVELAQSTTGIASTNPLGLVTETISNNQEGFITSFGLVRGINTTGALQGETWLEGDILYLSTTAGQLTKVAPTAPNPRIVMGYVVNVNSSNGTIFVRVNAGEKLTELDDVNITSPATGSIITWNGTVWVDSDTAPSSSFATSASYAATATSASYANTATSSSYAVTASYADNATIPSLDQVTAVGADSTRAIKVTGSVVVDFDGIQQKGILASLGSSVLVGVSGSATSTGNLTVQGGGLSDARIILDAAGGTQINNALTASGLIYPTSDGLSGNVLTTDGSGNLTLQAPAGGGDPGLISGSGANSLRSANYTTTNAIADAAGAIAIGDNAKVTGSSSTNTIAIGKNVDSKLNSIGNVIIGYNAYMQEDNRNDSVIIGNSAHGYQEGVAVGANAFTIYQAVALGFDAYTNDNYGIAIGAGARTNNNGGISIGSGSLQDGDGSIAIGKGAHATAQGDVVIKNDIGNVYDYDASANNLKQKGNIELENTNISASYSITVADNINSIVGGTSAELNFLTSNPYISGSVDSIIFGNRQTNTFKNAVNAQDVTSSIIVASGDVRAGSGHGYSGTGRLMAIVASEGSIMGGVPHGGLYSTQNSNVYGNSNPRVAAAIFGGRNHLINQVYSAQVYGGNNNRFPTAFGGDNGGILGGSNNTITGGGNPVIVGSLGCTIAGGASYVSILGSRSSRIDSGDTVMILGGGNHDINYGFYDTIVGGNTHIYNNRSNAGGGNSFLGGYNNEINGALIGKSTLLGGHYNKISGSLSMENSAIVGSSGSLMQHGRSVILGGSFYSSSADDQVIAPQMVLSGSLTNAGGLLAMEPWATLPAAASHNNSFAVSGSKPYFSDGTAWTALF